jgi:hypothetical protein
MGQNDTADTFALTEQRHIHRVSEASSCPDLAGELRRVRGLDIRDLDDAAFQNRSC